MIETIATWNTTPVLLWAITISVGALIWTLTTSKK